VGGDDDTSIAEFGVGEDDEISDGTTDDSDDSGGDDGRRQDRDIRE
jgi:hypothetical protein